MFTITCLHGSCTHNSESQPHDSAPRDPTCLLTPRERNRVRECSAKKASEEGGRRGVRVVVHAKRYTEFPPPVHPTVNGPRFKYTRFSVIRHLCTALHWRLVHTTTSQGLLCVTATELHPLNVPFAPSAQNRLRRGHRIVF